MSPGGLGLGSISAFFCKARRLPQKVLGASKPVKPWHHEGVVHGSFLRHPPPRPGLWTSQVANSQGPGGERYWEAPGSGLEEAVWTCLLLPLGGLQGHSPRPPSCCARKCSRALPMSCLWVTGSGKPALGGAGRE